jgi:hypothetical protein
MNRIKAFLLCLVLLSLVGIAHHLWLGASGTSGTSGIVLPAEAAILSNAIGTTCVGTCTWHFVNNQTQGQCGPLTATFNCDGTVFTTPDITPSSCLNSTDHYFVTTSGSCTLLSASTGTQPGRLVLSNLSVSPSPTPTPTPAPSPTPGPSPTP